MEQDKWKAVDLYLTEKIVRPDNAVLGAYRSSLAAGMPDIAVSAAQGKLLQLMASMMGAKRILEIGTLGGYSTIWLARALAPGGSLITLEFDPKHAGMARTNLANAGLSDRVEVKVGNALEILPTLTGPFDFFFIDANKDGYPEYFQWALKLSRPGSVMVFDNVVRGARVLEAASTDSLIQGVRALNEAIAAEPRVTATAIQTVGVKGYDGFCVAMVTE
jgi:predicted O-methyltransferase YrrM